MTPLEMREVAAKVAHRLTEIAENISPSNSVYPAPELRKLARKLLAIPIPSSPPRSDSGEDALVEALERVLIGGNHLGTYRTDKWPAPSVEPLVALEAIGAGPSYDMWCCWATIMQARDALDDYRAARKE
jgi:hypothetical protein